MPAGRVIARALACALAAAGPFAATPAAAAGPAGTPAHAVAPAAHAAADGRATPAGPGDAPSRAAASGGHAAGDAGAAAGRAPRADPGCAAADLDDPADTARAALAVRCLVNRERAALGLAPLRDNRCLARAAARHARDMVAAGYFAHVSRGGATPAERARLTGYLPRAGAWTVGENLAWGVGAGASPRAVVAGWMDSPGHRANILRPRHRDVGVAVVPGVPVPWPVPAAPSALPRATYVAEFGARATDGGRCDRPPERAARPRRRAAPAPPRAAPRGPAARRGVRRRRPARS